MVKISSDLFKNHSLCKHEQNWRIHFRRSSSTNSKIQHIFKDVSTIINSYQVLKIKTKITKRWFHNIKLNFPNDKASLHKFFIYSNLVDAAFLLQTIWNFWKQIPLKIVITSNLQNNFQQDSLNRESHQISIYLIYILKIKHEYVFIKLQV